MSSNTSNPFLEAGGQKQVPHALTTETQKIEYIASLFAPGTEQWMSQIRAVFEILLGWLSISLEVFLRRDFGERYLTNLRVFLAFLCMTGLAMLMGLAGMLNRTGGPGWAFFVAMFAFLLVSGAHIARIWWRRMKGIAWHSRSFGVSWYEWLREQDPTAPEVSDWVLYRFIEPGACMVLTIALFIAEWQGAISGFRGVANWMLISTVALIIKNNLVWEQHRWRMLDMIDSRIEAEFMAGAVGGRPKTKTAGFVVAPVHPNLANLVGVQTTPPVPPKKDDDKPLDVAAVVQETLNM